MRWGLFYRPILAYLHISSKTCWPIIKAIYKTYNKNLNLFYQPICNNYVSSQATICFTDIFITDKVKLVWRINFIDYLFGTIKISFKIRYSMIKCMKSSKECSKPVLSTDQQRIQLFQDQSNSLRSIKTIKISLINVSSLMEPFESKINFLKKFVLPTVPRWINLFTN